MRKAILLIVIFALVIFFRRPSRASIPASPQSPTQPYLSRLGSLASSAKLETQTLVISLTSGTELILDIEKSPDNWYSSLTAILDRSRVTGRYPSRIDLRSNRAIVTW